MLKFADVLLAEFDREAGLTRRVLVRVPSDRFEWRPHEKSMTLGRLVTHLAELPGWGRRSWRQPSTIWQTGRQRISPTSRSTPRSRDSTPTSRPCARRSHANGSGAGRAVDAQIRRPRALHRAATRRAADPAARSLDASSRAAHRLPATAGRAVARALRAERGRREDSDSARADSRLRRSVEPAPGQRPRRQDGRHHRRRSRALRAGVLAAPPRVRSRPPRDRLLARHAARPRRL